MTLFQLIATFFAFFMLYVVNIHRRKKTINKIEAYFWSTIWIVFVVISIFPDLLRGITQKLNFFRVFDLLTVIALMIISLVVFLNYFNQKEYLKKIEDFIREESINSNITKKKE